MPLVQRSPSIDIINVLQQEAGSYSPPTHKRTRSNPRFFDKPQSILRHFTTSDQLVSKPILKKLLTKSSLEEIYQITTQSIDLFSPTAIDWLINWSSRDFDNHVTQTSITALSFLAFPQEKIPKLRDRIFESSLINKIIRVGSQNKLPLSYHISLESLNIKEKLGSGAGGEVFRAKFQQKDVAVKFFKKHGCWFSCEKEFYYEATVMSLFGSFKNFMFCFGVNLQEGFIVMPMAANGSLETALQDNKIDKFDWAQKIKILSQISRSMRTLHRYGIMHRDLKPANVLVDENFNCFLADFGLSRSPVHRGVRTRSRAMTMNVGTSMFMAPELIDGNGLYSEQIDVFSFGVLMWQLVSDCAIPYLDQGIGLRDIPNFIKSGARLDIPDDCPDLLADLIEKCWHKNPKKRPSFQTIYSSLSTNI
mmetsp:Transcript_10069/g.15921  ORF Transcript_10069/g.15921 Transcript_10069/m.15921 type:complete len:420 (+) Transcript_10069:63-1322(+)